MQNSTCQDQACGRTLTHKDISLGYCQNCGKMVKEECTVELRHAMKARVHNIFRMRAPDTVLTR